MVGSHRGARPAGKVRATQSADVAALGIARCLPLRPVRRAVARCATQGKRIDRLAIHAWRGMSDSEIERTRLPRRKMSANDSKQTFSTSCPFPRTYANCYRYVSEPRGL